MTERKSRDESPVAEWARTTAPIVPLPRCTACAATPEVRDALNTVLRMHNRGESCVSMVQLADFIFNRWGVKLGKYTLQNHFAHHTAERWSDRRSG